MLGRIQGWARDYEDVLVDYWAPWRPPSRDWGMTLFRARKIAEARYGIRVGLPLLAIPLAAKVGVVFPALGLIWGAAMGWLLLVTAFYGLAFFRAIGRSSRETDAYRDTQPRPPWQ